MSLDSPNDQRTVNVTDRLGLTREQIAFAKIVGSALARRWRAQQREQPVAAFISSPTPNACPPLSDAG